MGLRSADALKHDGSSSEIPFQSQLTLNWSGGVDRLSGFKQGFKSRFYLLSENGVNRSWLSFLQLNLGACDCVVSLIYLCN